MQNSLIAYYRNQQPAHQWVDFLSALADELSSQASEDELHAMFLAVGKRQASLLEKHLEKIDGLEQLQDALNEYWGSQHWGFVNLQEKKGVVEIMHSASPLADAFGEPSLSWAVGFLEGFYEQIFKLMGAGRGMHVRAIDSEEAGLNLFFRFGKA